MYESGACTPYKLCLACSVVTGRAPWGHRRRASLGLYGHARELRGKLEEVVGVVPRVCGGRGGGGGGDQGRSESSPARTRLHLRVPAVELRGELRGDLRVISVHLRGLSVAEAGRGWRPSRAASGGRRLVGGVWREASGGRGARGGAHLGAGLGAARASTLEGKRAVGAACRAQSSATTLPGRVFCESSSSSPLPARFPPVLAAPLVMGLLCGLTVTRARTLTPPQAPNPTLTLP